MSLKHFNQVQRWIPTSFYPSPSPPLSPSPSPALSAAPSQSSRPSKHPPPPPTSSPSWIVAGIRRSIPLSRLSAALSLSQALSASPSTSAFFTGTGAKCTARELGVDVVPGRIEAGVSGDRIGKEKKGDSSGKIGVRQLRAEAGGGGCVLGRLDGLGAAERAELGDGESNGLRDG
ncbi:hypothetical protein Droror1_Dr00021987 [Drosera rotundifolia]